MSSYANHFRHFLAASGLLLAVALPVGAQDTEPPLDTGYVIYDNEPISLPFGVGLRIPSYNRVDGIAVPWGPDIRLANGKVRIATAVTYRSHIGELDPSAEGLIAVARADTIRFFGGRSTFSNDKWIRSDLVNSLTALAAGSDTRNYFRADRGEIEVLHTITRPLMSIVPSLGMLHEFAWSAGEPAAHTSAPWAAFGRKDDLKMRRINPAVVRGHTTSALGGLRVDYDDNVTKARLAMRAEHALDAPETVTLDGKFTQLTLDARADFPTFGLQRFKFQGHSVFTGGDAPPQRFVYLGGSGTLSTVDLLALGGDRLLFVEGEYEYPLARPVLQFVGAPVLTLRYAAGAAGLGELDEFIHNLSAGISLKVVKVAYHIDPSYRETPYRDKTSFSLSFQMPF
jgi:hypothetical protein